MANPEEYVMFDKRQKRRILSTLEEFSENFMNMCEKCMNVDCGPGDITKDILLPALGSNAQLIGTDISESMIKFANETYSDKKQLQIEVLDIQTKNLPKKYISEFDHILSFYALQWCNNIQQACENMYKMLRPNGTIFLKIIAYHDVFDVFKILTQDIRFSKYIPDNMKNGSPYQKSNNARKELKEVLESVGFTVHHCSLREISESDEKPEEFLILDDSLDDLVLSAMIEYENEQAEKKNPDLKEVGEHSMLRFEEDKKIKNPDLMEVGEHSKLKCEEDKEIQKLPEKMCSGGIEAGKCRKHKKNNEDEEEHRKNKKIKKKNTKNFEL